MGIVGATGISSRIRLSLLDQQRCVSGTPQAVGLPDRLMTRSKKQVLCATVYDV
jgi:hypothetical protein